MDDFIKLQDGLQNLTTGLGSAKDKKSFDAFQNRLISVEQLEAMYTNNWVSGKVVDIPADDMTREWRTVKSDDLSEDQLKKVTDEEQRLKLRKYTNEALKWASLYGGSAILLGLNEDMVGPPDEELDLDRVKEGALEYVKVVDKNDLIISELNNHNPMDENFGLPEFYQLNGATLQIHHSRVIPFLGRKTPRRVREHYDYWGPSTLQIMYDAIHYATLAVDATATTLHEFNVDIISIEDLWSKIGNDASTSELLKRFSIAQLGKSINRMLILDSTEKFERKGISAISSNIAVLINTFYEILSGASDITVTRFLNRSPAGLTATGEFDLKNYYNMIGSKQESDLEPQLAKFDQVMVRSTLGFMPENWEIEFNPLWQMSETEKTDNALKNAQRDNFYIQNGTLKNSQVAKQLQKDGTYDFVEDEGIAELEQDEDEIAEAERAQAEIERTTVAAGEATETLGEVETPAIPEV